MLAFGRQRSKYAAHPLAACCTAFQCSAPGTGARHHWGGSAGVIGAGAPERWRWTALRRENALVGVQQRRWSDAGNQCMLHMKWAGGAHFGADTARWYRVCCIVKVT